MDHSLSQTPFPRLSRRLRAQLGMLTAMFLLGMAVNLLGYPSETHGPGKTATTVFLALHALVAAGLLGHAVLIIMVAQKADPTRLRQAAAGASAIVITFIAGVATLYTKSNWWSFIMAAGFLASFLIYGHLYIRALK